MKSANMFSKKRIWSIFFFVVSIPVAYIAGLLMYSTVTDYAPKSVLPAKVIRTSGITAPLPDTAFSFLIWNLGYGGLGRENDFFYGSSTFFSGGHDIRPSKDQHERYQASIRQFLKSQRVDFFLLQEIDIASKRSYYTNQVDEIAQDLPGFSAHFFPNYQVSWVPVPLFEPWQAYGEARSGLATYGRFAPKDAQRFALPGAFAWPTRLFMLDRCLGLTRYQLSWGRDLVVINLHNEAYDRDGSLKAQQLGFLKTLLEKEYRKGNYVVVGGDWNQSPPYFKPQMLQPAYPKVAPVKSLDPAYLPSDWRWVFDPAVATNRSTAEPYKKGKTPVALIDFFLVSPNVRVIQAKALNQDFNASDHQPVWMEIRLED